MPKLVVFNQVTLDGYFTGANGDMRWAHKDPADKEWNDFVAGNASGGGALVFGRITYEMMASFWPTPMAAKQAPAVAKGMNAMPKYVFSRTLKDVSWSNTTLLRGDLATEIRKLKEGPGPDLAILGSGSLVAQLAPERLIDELQIVVNPLALGRGRTLFEGIKAPVSFKHQGTRTFANGSVVLRYGPA